MLNIERYADSLIGHGYYLRKPKGMQEETLMRIKRWYCKRCRKTISMLPDLLLSHRHYLLGAIVRVFELGIITKKIFNETIYSQCASLLKNEDRYYNDPDEQVIYDPILREKRLLAGYRDPITILILAYPTPGKNNKKVQVLNS